MKTWDSKEFHRIKSVAGTEKIRKNIKMLFALCKADKVKSEPPTAVKSAGGFLENNCRA